jgi:hypothetical protein
MACPKSDPCCNRCNYSGWRRKPADDQLLKLSGVAVPDPVQKTKGCGVQFELDLTGHYEGDSFVVRSFEKRPLAVEPEPAAKREGPKPAADLQTIHVVPGPAGCTRMRCPESNPCCNRCHYDGWHVKSAGTEPLKLSGVAVPDPVQKKKGCGVQFELDLTGHYEGDTFVVRSFKKRPPA